MELRRRRGDAISDARDSNVEASIGGTIGDNCFEGMSPNPKRPAEDKTEDSFHDGGFTPSGSQTADAVVGAAVRGGSLLMVLALVQRASTFVLNLLLQRAMLSADSDADDDLSNKTERGTTSALEEYGAAAITLELISSTALFLAREPFRVALARSRAPAEGRRGGEGGEGVGGWREREETQQQEEQQQRRCFVNTAWLSAPVGLAFAGVVQLAYPWVIRNDAFYGIEENRRAASLMCVAAAMELLCEPLALIFQYRLLVDVRVRAEAAAVLVLGVSRYLLVTRAGTGILSFGYAQLLHSATLAAAYVFFVARDVARGARIPRAKGVSITLEASESLTRQMASGASGLSLPSSSVAAPSILKVTPATVSAAGAATTSTAVTTPASPTPPPAADYRGGFSSVWGWLPGRPVRRSDGHTAEEWVDGGHLRLARALAGQSLLKHVLTEGDKIVLARATAPDRGGSGGGSGGGGQGGSLHEQGVYAIASGYGSLAARLLFQPVEEAARLMFSKLGVEGLGVDAVEIPAGAKLAAGEVGAAARQVTDRGQDIDIDNGIGRCSGKGNDSSVDDESHSDVDGGGGDRGREARTRMAALLATLLKLVLTAGLVFVCFGFHYTETLMRLLLAGKRAGRGGGEGDGATAVTEVSRVLSWYCVYVLFLAANGMCEAFSSAVARGGQLTGMGAGLVASFAVFWALVRPLTSRFGTRGLVMANASGMACRVLCSAAFIRRFFLHQAPTASTLRHRQRQHHRSSECSPQVTTMAAERPSTPPHSDGPPVEKNLWRQIVNGALPHPFVAAAMVASSAVAHAASPNRGGGDAGGVGWDAPAAAQHVALGGVCFAATALVFARYEGVFLREIRALWATRRRGGGEAGAKSGAAVVTRTEGGGGPLSRGAAAVRNKTD